MDCDMEVSRVWHCRFSDKGIVSLNRFQDSKCPETSTMGHKPPSQQRDPLYRGPSFKNLIRVRNLFTTTLINPITIYSNATMQKSIRETSVKSLFLGKEITDEDLQARYKEYLATNPTLPQITISENGTATVVASYFEDTDPKAFSAVLEHEKAPEAEVELDDPEGFDLYTPEGEKDEIDWDEEDKPKEMKRPEPVVEVKEKLSVSRNSTVQR
jgi:hypothetical protein